MLAAVSVAFTFVIVALIVVVCVVFIARSLTKPDTRKEDK